MNDDGSMARMPDLVKFREEHGIKIVTIKDLIRYRMKNESLVRRSADAKLPTRFGEFRVIAYENMVDDNTHLALVKGDVAHGDEVLVRVHSECLTGDVFGSTRCDCGDQLHKAMEVVDREGRGVILYMRQEGRGIGLANKLKAYELQDTGMDTVEANEKLGFKPDLRDYGIGAQILVDLGLGKINILTNNPRKIVGLEGYGLKVNKRIPIESDPCPGNLRYLCTKKEKLGHMLENV